MATGMNDICITHNSSAYTSAQGTPGTNFESVKPSKPFFVTNILKNIVNIVIVH